MRFTAVSLFLFLISTRSGFAAKCDGRGVAETLAEVEAACCPAHNHGQYVSCAAHVANQAIKDGTLSASCKHEILRHGCPAPTTTSTTIATTTTATTTTAPTTTSSSTTTTASTSSTSTTTAPPVTSTTTTIRHHTTTTSSSTTSTSLASTTTTSSTVTSTTIRQTTTTSTASSSTSTTTTSTASSTSSSTTTTTPAPTTTTQRASTTTSTTTPSTAPLPPASSTTTLPGPREICGNCIDDDGDGLTDFEDPACCLQTFSMTLTRGRLQPRDGASRLRLKALLAQTGLQGVDPLQQNVFLQIRQPGTGEVLCAQMPAAKFMRMHGIFKFWDHKHTVPSAKGIDDLAVVVRSDGSVRFRTFGRRVQMETPPAGPLQITVAFQDPTGDGRGTCSSTVQEFHAQGGGLRAP